MKNFKGKSELGGIAALATLSLLFFPFFASASVDFASVSLNPLSQGLVGYWPLDGDTTSWTTDTAKDISGNNYTGTLVNMSTTTSPTIGKTGQALKFNGTNTYIQTSYTIPAQSSSTSFTWSVWIKLGTGNPGNVVIIGNRGGGGSTWIKLTPTAFEYSGGVVSHTIPTGAWVQVTVVKNGTNFTYYQNGVAIGAATNSGSTSAYTFYMGEDPGYTGDGDLTGALDEVRVYSRALSPQEVQLLYSLGTVKAGNTPQANASAFNFGLSAGLAAYWPLDGNTINWTSGAAADESGSGNTATLVAMSTTTSPTIGKIGQALNFNGSNQYFLSGSFGTPPQSITLSVWIKPNSSGGDVITELGQNSINNTWYDTQMEVETNNVIKVCVWTGSETCVNAASGITYGKWYNVVLDYNVSTHTLTGYGNGVAGGSTTATKQYPPIALYYAIGAGSNTNAGNGNYFSGAIDDVRVYSRALSYQEVQDLYKEGVVAIGNSPTLSTPAGTGLNAGLVGYWTFDGPETSWATGITQDSSGQGNNGVMLGMSTTTSPTIGKIGQALNFNGTSSYINVSPFPSTHSVLTVSAWVYPTSLSQSSFGSASGGTIIDEDEGGGSAGWVFGVKNNNTLWFWPSGSNDKYSTGTVPLNKWTFVTATYDGTNIRFYINGALDSTQTMSTPQGSATFFKIGAESWTTGYWKGKLDDVRIYSRALSSQEVAQLYAAGR